MSTSRIGRSLFMGFPTTYPQPLGTNKHLIKGTDVFKTFNGGQLKLVLARPEHAPILTRSVIEMYKNEVTNIAAGTTEIPEDAAEILVYNCLRNPISFFALNQKDEVVSIACANILYLDNGMDPLPRREPFVCADRQDPFQANADLITVAENRSFERLGVDRLVHHELAFTPTTVRGQKISGTIYPTVLKRVINFTTQMGFRYNVGMVTSQANLNNMVKLGYTAVENLPMDIYKKVNGTPMILPPEETTATLIQMDMVEMKAKGRFDNLE